MANSLIKMKTLARLASAVAVGCAACLSACGTDGKAAQSKQPTVDAVPVEVAAAARTPISANYSGTASLVADHEAQVVAKTMRRFEENATSRKATTVKAGQLLAEIDDARRAQQAQRRPKPRCTSRKRRSLTPKRRYRKQLIPQFEYEQDKFDLQDKRAALETARSAT